MIGRDDGCSEESLRDWAFSCFGGYLESLYITLPLEFNWQWRR